MDFSDLAVSSSDYQVWGGLLFLVVVAKATRSESRTLLTAIAGSILASTPATLYVVGVLAIVFKLFDGLNLGRD